MVLGGGMRRIVVVVVRLGVGLGKERGASIHAFLGSGVQAFQAVQGFMPMVV